MYFSTLLTLLGLLWIVLNLQRHALDSKTMQAPTKTCKSSVLRFSWLFGLNHLLYLGAASRQYLLAGHGRHDDVRRSYRFLLTQLPDTEIMHRHDSWYLAQLPDDGFALSTGWCTSEQDVSASKSCLCQSLAACRKEAYSLRGRALLAIIIAMPTLTAGSA